MEEAWIDDLKATAKDGTILFYQDFSLASDTQFDGGEVVDGQLHVKCEDDNVQSDKVFFEKDTENYYRFDVDFTINSGAIKKQPKLRLTLAIRNVPVNSFSYVLLRLNVTWFVP